MMDQVLHQDLLPLKDAVQRNCHRSDALHGGDYGMCTYLLKMREYYRWEHGLDFNDSLPNEDVGDWLTRRETLWSDLAEQPFEPLPLSGAALDPFDVEAINAELESFGLVYGAGYGVKRKPLFFLAQLERREQPGNTKVLVSGREWARDLSAPAAMNQGDSIYLRQESFRRLIWEKLENWRWRRADNAMGRAFACYDFEGDLHAALDAMTGHELNAVLLHEQGEYLCGRELGDDWNQLLTAAMHTPLELRARAVRDHWADCRSTLPDLLSLGDPASIHFYFGALSGMRAQLFPGLVQAYERWVSEPTSGVLHEVVHRGEAHWSGLANEIVADYRERGDESLADSDVKLALACL